MNAPANILPDECWWVALKMMEMEGDEWHIDDIFRVVQQDWPAPWPITKQRLERILITGSKIEGSA